MQCSSDNHPHRCVSWFDSGKMCASGLSCNRWDCDTCKPRRLRGLKSLAKSGRPTTMITLTCRHTSFDSPAEAAQRLVQSWRLVLQRAKREGIAAGVEYLCVFEQHKSGWPHLHILCRAPYIDQQWLSDRMAEYADGPNVWIRKVRSQRMAAYYVSKYCSKGPHRYDGCKRYWRSQGYQVEDIDASDGVPVHDRRYQLHRVGLLALADVLRRTGWEVVGTEPGGWIAKPPDFDCPMPQAGEWEHLERGPPNSGS